MEWNNQHMEWKKQPGWLVSALDRIRDRDLAAEAELCEFLLPGLRLLARRRSTTQDADDLVNEALIVVLAAARAGNIRSAKSVAAFARTVVRNLAASKVQQLTKARSWLGSDHLVSMPSPRSTPEQSLVEDQRAVVTRRVLAEMKSHEREILRRFYLEEQPPEQICIAMGLSTIQFRLLKSRAKARFGQIGREEVLRKSPEPRGTTNLPHYHLARSG